MKKRDTWHFELVIRQFKFDSILQTVITIVCTILQTRFCRNFESGLKFNGTNTTPNIIQQSQ